MTEHAYLDWNATAQLRPEAREAVLAALETGGNPSSVHGAGRARAGWSSRPASSCGAGGRDAPRGCFHLRRHRGQCSRAEPTALGDVRLLVSAIEHPSVRAGGRFAAVEEIPVTADGVVDLDALKRRPRERVAAAGFHHARQQRDRRGSAGRAGGRACSRRGRPSACRRGAGAGQYCLRFQGARRRSDDAVGAQDRRAAGCRRADQARRGSIWTPR